LALTVLSFSLNACKIEEIEPVQSGSVQITLMDTSGTEIIGARISVDGRDTPRYTPATLSGLSVGTHHIGAFKPGYVDTNRVVDVVADQTVAETLFTYAALDGSIDLPNAPDGTVLILNNVPVGALPTVEFPPTLFSYLGVGTFRATAYLVGHATELPAQWVVDLTAGTTVPLAPLFTPVSDGAEPNDLAPAFELPSDWDRTLYRLQDYRGQVVLVSFFFYNCTVCVDELPYLQSAYSDAAYADRLQVLGVDFVDSYSTFARFRDEHAALGLTFPLLHDASQQLRDAYGVNSHPANFLVDQTGRIYRAQGALSEGELRQMVDDLLSRQDSPTFEFSMRDTLIEYSDGNRSYEFNGQLRNLIAAERVFRVTLQPVDYPDSSRQSSICTYRGCYPPRSGPISVVETYRALQTDSTFRVDLYNYVTDWSQGDPVTVDSALHGDYVLDIAVSPMDNSRERITHRLHLMETSGGLLVRAVPWLRD